MRMSVFQGPAPVFYSSITSVVGPWPRLGVSGTTSHFSSKLSLQKQNVTGTGHWRLFLWGNHCFPAAASLTY